ncbi:MAG: hypothetical protein ACI8P9_000335 [Parasphingorhabdus sp.]|jgi:hypothetical protein
MFYMLSCFNLKPNHCISDFEVSYIAFVEEMKLAGLVQSSDKVGRRQKDTPMDTDDDRDHEYFVVMSFTDRAQVDKAYAYIMKHIEPGEKTHDAIYSKVDDPVFICWQDIS